MHPLSAHNKPACWEFIQASQIIVSEDSDKIEKLQLTRKS